MRLSSPAAAMLIKAPRPSFTASHLVRLTPWVHARRKVPVSNSRETSGAPQNIAMRRGTTSRRKSRKTCKGPSELVKLVVTVGQSCWAAQVATVVS